jgi:FAD/FMN-containing dehydrogenase
VNGKSGGDYLEAQYPNWQTWKTKRSSLDPLNVFVNPYWKNQLANL